MGVEIERKFLVDHEAWNQLSKPEGKVIKQMYLTNEADRVIRVRIKGNQGYLTIKSSTNGISRLEFEYEIPLEDAKTLFAQYGDQQIDKIRYVIPAGNHEWEIDVFHGKNEGLIVAEIELESEDESFDLPEWVTREVSDDLRYYNMNLLQHPYSEWKDKL